jgi:serine/threonine-protein kinase
MTKPAPPIASVMPSLPAPLCAVIDRALAFDMDARWPDARAMQAALRAAAGQQQEQASSPQPLGSTASAPAVGPESIGRPSSLTRTTAPVTQAARAATFDGSTTAAPKRKGTAAAIAVALATLGTIGAAAFVLLGRSQPADEATPAAAAEATAVAPVAPASETAASMPAAAEPAPEPSPSASAVASGAASTTVAATSTAAARAPNAPPRATASPHPPSATAKPASPKKSADPLDKF